MKTFRTALLFFTVLVALLLTTGAVGQSDPDDDATAALAALDAARVAFLNADAAALTLNDTYTETQTFTLDDDQAQITISQSDVGTVQLVRTADGPNIDGTITSTYERINANFERDTYEALIALRLVEGTLYAQTSYAEHSGDVPELTDGWRVLESEDDLPLELLTLGLDTLTDPATPFDLKLARLIGQAEFYSSVFITPLEAADNGAVRRITLIARGTDFGRLLEDNYATDSPELLEDPFTAALLEELQSTNTNASSVTYNLLVDTQGRLVGGDTAITIQYNNIDLDTVLPGTFPAGAVLNFRISTVANTTIVYDIMAEPVTAPIEPATSAE